MHVAFIGYAHSVAVQRLEFQDSGDGSPEQGSGAYSSWCVMPGWVLACDGVPSMVCSFGRGYLGGRRLHVELMSRKPEPSLHSTGSKRHLTRDQESKSCSR